MTDTCQTARPHMKEQIDSKNVVVVIIFKMTHDFCLHTFSLLSQCIAMIDKVNYISQTPHTFAVVFRPVISSI